MRTIDDHINDAVEWGKADGFTPSINGIGWRHTSPILAAELKKMRLKEYILRMAIISVLLDIELGRNCSKYLLDSALQACDAIGGVN